MATNKEKQESLVGRFLERSKELRCHTIDAARHNFAHSLLGAALRDGAQLVAALLHIELARVEANGCPRLVVGELARSARRTNKTDSTTAGGAIGTRLL